MKLLCIDGNSILNRSFYGVRDLTAGDGTPTNALFGFINILMRLINNNSPDGIVVAFDLHAPTFRHKMFDGYKAGRHAMPDELRVQMPIAKDIIRMFGYSVVEKEGYEADDFLGAFAHSCESSGCECVIATGDRDSLQLVRDNVTVSLATTKEIIMYTPDKIQEVYGVQPAQLIDVKALMGDKSDNIPGVSGIGEKTALKLIAQYKTLDGVYQNLDGGLIKPKMREKLEAEKETAYLSQKLAKILEEIPGVDTSPERYINNPMDKKGLTELLSRLDMVSIIKKLNLKQTDQPAEKLINKERAVVTCPDYSQAEELLKNCERIDILTDFQEEQLYAVYLFTDENIIKYDFGADAAFRSLIAEDQRPKRVSDVKKLYKYTMQNGVELNNVVFDMKLASYLLDSGAKQYEYAELSEKYLTDISCGQEYGLYPELCDKLETDIKLKQMDDLLCGIEIPFARVLSEMEITGFYIDRDGVSAFGEMLKARIDELTDQIYLLAGEEFNINSTVSLSHILFEKLGLPAGKKTKSGYSTNASVLEKLLGKHPVIEAILEYRKLTKLHSTYVAGLIKEVQGDGRIHSVFKQTETRTGRISSTEPNMQNIPVRTHLGREMRRFFVAKDGYLLVDADYSQIELRILAALADDANMKKAFNDGIDIHAMTASQVFGIPIEQMPSEIRSRAKAINFGIVYGIGAFSLSRDIGVTVAQASQYIKDYLNTYSGVKRYLEQTVENGKRSGYVSTLFGRRRELPELASKNKNIKAFGERAAMNAPIQGTAADIIKLAMINVSNRLIKEGIDAKIILQVHDEILLEAKEDCAEKAERILVEEMENAADLSVPLKVDSNVAKSWYLAKE